MPKTLILGKLTLSMTNGKLSVREGQHLQKLLEGFRLKVLQKLDENSSSDARFEVIVSLEGIGTKPTKPRFSEGRPGGLLG